MIVIILIILFVGPIVAYIFGDVAIMTLEAAEKKQRKQPRTRKAARQEKINKLIKERDEHRKKHGLGKGWTPK